MEVSYRLMKAGCARVNGRRLVMLSIARNSERMHIASFSDCSKQARQIVKLADHDMNDVSFSLHVSSASQHA